LRIDAEQRVGRTVTGIRTDDGKAHVERIVQRAAAAHRSGGGHHVAVGAAVGLVEEAAVPVVRQAHFKADGVALAVDRAGALVHLARDLAMRGNRLAGDGQRAGIDGPGAGDGGVGDVDFGG
jgi:hypothetical protein